eukprot:scaffold390787_cov45-Prasinocladus_malaysianus.AAC.1
MDSNDDDDDHTYYWRAIITAGITIHLESDSVLHAGRSIATTKSARPFKFHEDMPPISSRPGG